MFGKWFASAYTGSMYGAGPEVFAVWGWVVANAGAKGVLEINPRVLAGLIGAKPEAMTKAIAYLCAPDPESRTDDLEGARLEHLEAFTYRVVNHAQYRAARNEEERREYKTQKQREYRERDKPSCPQVSTVDNVDRGGPKAEGRRQSSEAEVKEPTSELASEPTESAPSHDAPGEPAPPLRSEDTTAVAKAPHNGTSQASKAMAVVPMTAEMVRAKHEPPKSTPKYIPEAYEAASYLFAAIRSHSPGFISSKTHSQIEKKLTGWTRHMDLLIRVDEKTLAEVKAVIDFCHRDDPSGFERPNIQSGAKLRLRFESLSTKTNPVNHKPPPGQQVRAPIVSSAQLAAYKKLKDQMTGRTQ